MPKPSHDTRAAHEPVPTSAELGRASRWSAAHWNWYVPHWLEWLPRVGAESKPREHIPETPPVPVV